jgi:hypothetical protein
LLGQHSPTAHRDPNLLHGNFARRPGPKNGPTLHRSWLAGIDGSFGRSKEDFVLHFNKKYAGSDLPIRIYRFGCLSSYGISGSSPISIPGSQSRIALPFPSGTASYRRASLRPGCAV